MWPGRPLHVAVFVDGVGSVGDVGDVGLGREDLEWDILKDPKTGLCIGLDRLRCKVEPRTKRAIFWCFGFDLRIGFDSYL